MKFRLNKVRSTVLEFLESRDLLTTIPANFAEFQVGGRLDSAPVTVLQAPDGRFFISTDDNDDTGTIRVIKNGNELRTPALQFNIVSLGEHGMLGMVLDPNFQNNNYLYLMYTTNEGGLHNRVSRFTFQGDRINRGSERILIELDPLGDGTVHNGGGMAFGRDGKLYLGVGDNQVATYAEDLTTVLGKILRINPDGSIPTDNPFYNQTSGKNRAIYATGVRNPFTMTADPSTGRIFFNDVGPASFEEINEVKRGVDYGWPSQGAGPNRDSGFEDPVYAYRHNGNPGGCAITGGRFHRTSNPSFPSQYTDKYYFTDYCGAWIYSYDLDTGNVEEFASDLRVRPVSPWIGDDGSIYYLSREERALLKIEYQVNNALQVTRQPEDVQVAAGQDATFAVEAAGNGTFNYQWQQRSNNSISFSNIAGARSRTLTVSSVPANADGREYRVVVSNGSESVTSRAAELTVNSGSPPEPVISSPNGNLTYKAGDTISFSGYATDPDQSGNLPLSNLSWEVTFQHDDHDHPVLGPVSGQSGGSFSVPTIGETSANTWFRIHLTAVDESGLQTYTFRDIFPRKSTFTLDSNIDGIELLLDGTPVDTSTDTLGVVGVQRSIGANSPQTVNGRQYEFVSWSDGGSRSHTISTPASDQIFTATFREIVGDPDPGGDVAGVVTHLAFDEGSGTTANDSATAGSADSAFVDGASWTNDGARGSVLRFDGLDDRVLVPDSTDFNNRDVDKLTLGLWFHADDVTNSGRQVLFKQQGTTRGLNIYLEGGRLYVGAWNDKTDWSGTFLSTNNVRSGQWHHVAVVLDAGEQLTSNGIRGYLDGARFGSGAATIVEKHLGDVSIGYLAQATRFHSGESNVGVDQGSPFAGLIDEVRLYHRPLSDSEVATLAGGSEPDDGCGYNGGAEVDPCVPAPELSVNFRPGDTAGEFVANLSLSNFRIAPESSDGPSVLNEGHMHLLIDGQKVGRFFDVVHTFTVPPGEHFVEVELSTNDHFPWTVDGTPIRVGDTLFVVEDDIPNVTTDGRVVTAMGTDGDDQFELSLDNQTHVLTVNGRSFVFNANNIDTFNLRAATGNDQVRVNGTDSSDNARILGNEGFVRSGGYEVYTYDFDDIVFDARGGNDYVQVFGSDDVDTLEGLPGNSTLLTPSHTFQMLNYARVDSYGRRGDDRAQVYGTDSNDDFYTFDDYEVLRGPGHHQTTKGFVRVDAYGRGGYDTAHLFDTTGDDHLYSFTTYAVMQSAATKSVVKGFELVESAATRGGNDTAHLWNLSSSEHLFASGDVAVVRGPERFVIADEFGVIDLQTKSGETPTTDIRSTNFVLVGSFLPQGEPVDDIDTVFAQIGDANLDGLVDFADFLIVANNYEREDRVYVWQDGDFNGDGRVDFQDFLELSYRYD